MKYNKKIFFDGTGASETMARLRESQVFDNTVTLNQFHIEQLLSMISNMQDIIDKDKQEIKLLVDALDRRKYDRIHAMCYASEALRTLPPLEPVEGPDVLRKIFTEASDTREKIIGKPLNKINAIKIKNGEIIIQFADNPNPPTLKT